MSHLSASGRRGWCVVFALLTCALLLIGAPGARAQSAVATVSVGTAPVAVAVNPVTNKIYVANSGSDNVTVIDGVTNITTAVPVGHNPQAVAVNSATNKIYVANSGSGNVTVIDGATNATTTVSAGSGPRALAVNEVTNKIYVANQTGDSVTIIDGTDKSTITLYPGGPVPTAVAVNPVTNKIYVANMTMVAVGSVTVINGADNTFTNVTVGMHPRSLAVNPVTNKIYVANYGFEAAPNYVQYVTVIDGATNATTNIPTVPIAVPSNPLSYPAPHSIAANTVTSLIYVTTDYYVEVIHSDSTATDVVGSGLNANAIAVNETTNVIYACDQGNNVEVIDGHTLAPPNRIPAGSDPVAVAVNSVTNKVYVANNLSNDVTVIDGRASGSTTTVTADPSQQMVGSSVTFTAHVAPVTGSQVPTGGVDFYEGTTLLQAAAPLDGSGNAVYRNSSLAMGDHTVTAFYAGDTTFASSSGAATVRMFGLPDSVWAVLGELQSSPVGWPFPSSLGVVVRDALGSLVPGVQVTFSGSGLSFSNGGVAVTGWDGRTYIVATPTAVGGLIAYAAVAGVSTPASFALTGTSPLTVTADNTAKVYGMGDPAMSATISGFVNGETAAVVTGAPTFTVSGTGGVIRPVGSYSVTPARGTLAAPAHYSFVFAAGTLTVTPATTATVVSTTLVPTTTGATYKFAATVVPQFTGLPTGTVDFFEGTTKLGTGVLDAHGVATYTTTTSQLVAPASGSPVTHTITAQFNQDANFLTSKGTTAVTLAPPVAAAAGQAIAPITVDLSNPTGNTLQTFSLTCAVIDGNGKQVAQTTCAVNPASTTLPKPGAVVTITTTKGSATTASMTMPRLRLKLYATVMGLPLTLFLGVMLSGTRRKEDRKRRLPGWLALALILTIMVIFGCGGGGSNSQQTTQPEQSSQAGTPAGSYVAPVTASFTDAQGVHTFTVASINVTVQ